MLIGETDDQCERDHIVMVTAILFFPWPIVHNRESCTTILVNQRFGLTILRHHTMRT